MKNEGMLGEKAFKVFRFRMHSYYMMMTQELTYELSYVLFFMYRRFYEISLTRKG